MLEAKATSALTLLKGSLKGLGYVSGFNVAEGLVPKRANEVHSQVRARTGSSKKGCCRSWDLSFSRRLDKQVSRVLHNCEQIAH